MGRCRMRIELPDFEVRTFLFIIGFTCSSLFAQKSSSDFVFTVNTTNPGFSNSNSYHLNILNLQTVNYFFDIDWNNDGIFDTLGVSSSITHNYANGGIYTIRLRGQFPILRLGDYKTNISDRSKLIAVDQWGNQPWLDVLLMFIHCDSLLTTPLDTPDFSAVTSLSSMFYGAKSFNGPVNHWDISNVISTNLMFYEAESFNQPVNDWDVSSLLFATRMFAGARSFNQPVNCWNLSSINDMLRMFEGATSFNQSINSWNTSQCFTMFSMFMNATSFNQPMDSLDVSSVMDFGGMFENATSFDQDISNWNFNSANQLRWFLDHTSMSVNHYDDLLIHLGTSYPTKNLEIGVEGLEYCSSSSIRTSLIQSGWQFSGDTISGNCMLTSQEEIRGEVQEVLLYPNPTTGLVRVLNATQNTSLIVYNQLGNKVLEMNGQKGLKEYSLNNLENGVYFIQIGEVFEKLILQK